MDHSSINFTMAIPASHFSHQGKQLFLTSVKTASISSEGTGLIFILMHPKETMTFIFYSLKAYLDTKPVWA